MGTESRTRRTQGSRVPNTLLFCFFFFCCTNQTRASRVQAPVGTATAAASLRRDANATKGVAKIGVNSADRKRRRDRTREALLLAESEAERQAAVNDLHARVAEAVEKRKRDAAVAKKRVAKERGLLREHESAVNELKTRLGTVEQVDAFCATLDAIVRFAGTSEEITDSRARFYREHPLTVQQDVDQVEVLKAAAAWFRKDVVDKVPLPLAAREAFNEDESHSRRSIAIRPSVLALCGARPAV